MVTSRLPFNRLLLLALLPVIALTIYFKGQHYDPALIQFDQSGHGQGVSVLPDEANGLKKTGQIRQFTKENLYEYVNGHAEYFISAGFVSLAVAEYAHEGTQPQKQSELIVEVYDMGAELNAFGVLADETSADSEEVQVGMMGFKTAQGISFIQGPYYIKINSFLPQTPYEELARQIVARIPVTSEKFSLFSKFPDIGETVTTRFIKEGYRGLPFLNNVLERQYSINGQTAYVFIVTASDTEINQLTATFLNFFKDNSVEFTKVEKENRQIYQIADPYEGNWLLVPLGDTLVGIFGAEAEQILEAMLK
jgi:hypothetical protein